MSGSPFGILEYITGQENTKATQQTAQNAQNLEWQMYSQNRADQLPLIQAGQTAINQLSSLMQPGGRLYSTDQYTIDKYQQDPYNKWLTQQGLESIQAQSAAAGNIGSGNMGTALVNYSQNMAEQGYSDWYNRMTQQDTNLYNRLMGIVSPSQTAATQVGNAGMNMASTTGSNNLYANQLAAMYRAQGIAGLGNTSGQIGNQIIGGVGAYQRNNAYYDMYSQNWAGNSNMYEGIDLSSGYGSY